MKNYFDGAVSQSYLTLALALIGGGIGGAVVSDDPGSAKACNQVLTMLTGAFVAALLPNIVVPCIGIFKNAKNIKEEPVEGLETGEEVSSSTQAPLLGT